MTQSLFFLLLAGLFFGVDFYISGALKHRLRNLSEIWQRIFWRAYWLNSFLIICSLLSPLFFDITRTNGMWLIVFVSTNLLARIFGIGFVVLDDIRRTFLWLKRTFFPTEKSNSPLEIEPVDQKITRSEFLTKTALFAASLPVATMGYGILSGAHDYTVHRITLRLPNLPKKFHGLKLAQLSDIHAGSFTNKRAVVGGLEMLLAEKPDVIVFTGDLVNTLADELKGWQSVFEKVRAPLGVYSVRGNHDYSDYGSWKSAEEKAENSAQITKAHAEFGWTLLRNEHKRITIEGEEIGILGSENWGNGRFSKYGNMRETISGTDDLAIKILLSHDPTHWEAQILPFFPQIDLQLAGHTHGAQLGVEWGDFRWSPAQYIYKQWAGLYEQNSRYLYVNRGFGYIGIPSRMGIPPEITVFELLRG